MPEARPQSGSFTRKGHFGGSPEGYSYSGSALELHPHRHLAGAIPAKVRTAGRGNLPEPRIGDIQNRIAQVRMIQNICKRALHAQMDAFGNLDPLAEPSRQIDGSGPLDLALVPGA